MLILSIKTDQPNAELGLYEDYSQLQGLNWEAGRHLAETLNKKIVDLLKIADKDVKDLNGIVVFKGPGSFTGLRIGLTVANSMAYGLGIPIIGSIGDDWAENGLKRLIGGSNDDQIIPEYGAPVHITPPKK